MLEFLVIGSGFLGKQILQKLAGKKINALGTCFNCVDSKYQMLDIRDISEIRKYIKKIKPKIIVNCAAITDLDYLENNKKSAYSVNAEGARNLAIVANENNIRLIHISTDSIFDGKNGDYSEEDIPNPVNIYGKSKLQGEKYIQEIHENYLIIRSNFYGLDDNRKTLLNWIISTLQKNETLTGFEDVFFSPLEVSNLSELIIELALKPMNGIIHLASDKRISKYQFIIEVAEIFGFNKDLIKKGSLNDAKLIAQRPRDTSLSNLKSKEILDLPQLPTNPSLQKIKNSCRM